MIPDNNALATQRKVDDLARRLALLESVIAVSGNNATISAAGNLTIKAGNFLLAQCVNYSVKATASSQMQSLGWCNLAAGTTLQFQAAASILANKPVTSS